jgi:hypothetical protein
MVRRVSDQEAQAKQDEMAQAALRRISRRLYNARNSRHADEHTEYVAFLVECREDVSRGPMMWPRKVA